MPDKKMQIIGITIDDMAFDAAPSRHRARVRFLYDLGDVGAPADHSGQTDCLCHSNLPANARPGEVRNDLIRNGLGQLRRMPEVWLGETDIQMCLPGDTAPKT